MHGALFSFKRALLVDCKISLLGVGLVEVSYKETDLFVESANQVNVEL